MNDNNKKNNNLLQSSDSNLGFSVRQTFLRPDDTNNDFKVEDIANYEYNDPAKINTNSSVNIQNGNQIASPIKLIDFTKKTFELNPEALDILRSISEEVIIVSIVGKARTGKSYLMNLLLNSSSNNKNNGFEVASTINSCTRGIWLWSSPIQKANSNAKIIFIDSEGTNSVDISTKTYDSKIFALVVLISSLFIYNTVGNIDEKSIGELALAAHLSTAIATNSKLDTEKTIMGLAPKFVWCLRDFTLDKVDPTTNEEISSDEYLEMCLRNKISGKNSVENNLIRENIIKYFKSRECVTLPRPVDKEDDLKRLNEIPFDSLKPNFRTEFLELKRKIYYEADAKRVNGIKINGKKLAELLTAFVDAINKGAVPNISTAWDSIVKNDIESQYEQSRRFYQNAMTNIEKQMEKNKNKRNSYLLIKSLEVDKNNLVYDLYKTKYNTLLFYQKVAMMNSDILTNPEYLKLYNEFKRKLEEELDREIKKKIEISQKNNASAFKSLISKNSNVLDSKMFNDAYDAKDNFASLINDYIGLLRDIEFSSSSISQGFFPLFAKTEASYSRDILYYIAAHAKTQTAKQLATLEGELAKNEIELKHLKTEQLREINETYLRRFTLLNNDLFRKEKEIDELNEKITKLKNKREKMRKEKKNNLLMSSMRKGKNIVNVNDKYLIGTTQVDGEEKGCECNFATGVCIIF